MPSADAQHNVTVVLATFNGERFLPEQLASIAAQSLLPAELLIVDDGSTDATADIVAEFARSAPLPVRWEVNATRLGYADNFLRAASRVTTALVAFSDQDDVWLPRKLELGTAPFTRGRVMLTVHDAIVVDAALAAAARPRLRSGVISRALLSRPWVTPLGSRMVCRSALFRELSIDDRPTSLGAHVDMAPHDEWVHYAAHALGEVVYLRQPLLLYRRHEKTTTELPQNRTRRRWLAAPPPDVLDRHRQAAHSRAAHLRADADRAADDVVRRRLLAAARGYDRSADHFSRRVAAQRALRRRDRVARLAATALRGGYGRQSNGGFGWLPLLQDLAALRPPRSSG